MSDPTEQAAPDPGTPRFVLALSLTYSFPEAAGGDIRRAVEHAAAALAAAGLLLGEADGETKDKQ